MAKYTIELGTLVEMGFKVFDASWATFVPSHKKELCDKIIRHYYFNEIGAEVPERFRHYINTHLAEIMPTYNKLYESDLWELVPLYNQFIETSSLTETQSSDIRDTISRTDRATLQLFGESLNRELNSDEWVKLNQNVHGITNETGNLTGTHDETEGIDTTGTKVYNKTQDNEMNETANRTIDTVTNSKEVMDDDTTKNTTGRESTNRNNYSSDTPQGRVTEHGVSIDSAYLTNYSHEDTSRNYNEDVTGTDDRTTTFDKTENVKDNLTRNVTEDNVEDYDEKTTGHSNRNKHNGDKEDTTGWKDENVDTESTTHTSKHEEVDESKQNTTQNNGTSTTADSNSGRSKENANTTTVSKGSVGVSKVDLLNKYRQSLINIDLMIIKELSVEFMGIF